LGFAFRFTGRCFGPLLAAAVTAVMNRSHPSGRNSIFDSVFLSDLATVNPRIDWAVEIPAAEVPGLESEYRF
jgi:hypothetical protein